MLMRSLFMPLLWLTTGNICQVQQSSNTKSAERRLPRELGALGELAC